MEEAARVRAVADRLNDLSPILQIVGENVRAFIDDRFATATAPDGAPWRPLSMTTVAVNPRRAGGSPLADTGRLRASITYDAQSRSLSFGTNVVYAAKQHFGDPNNRMFGGSPAPVPARAYLLVDQAGNLVPREFWEEQFCIIERWIATGEVS